MVEYFPATKRGLRHPIASMLARVNASSDVEYFPATKRGLRH